MAGKAACRLDSSLMHFSAYHCGTEAHCGGSGHHVFDMGFLRLLLCGQTDEFRAWWFSVVIWVSAHFRFGFERGNVRALKHQDCLYTIG